MKILLIILICVNIFKGLHSAGNEDPKLTERKSAPIISQNIVPAESISPEVLPAFSGPIQEYPGLSSYPVFGVQQPCTSGCTQVQPCIQGCSQQLVQSTPGKTVTVKVPVRISKTIPEQIIRKTQKQSRYVKVAMDSSIDKKCPDGYRMNKDGSGLEYCDEERGAFISCPEGYEYRDEKCVRVYTACANEQVKVREECIVRTICPKNYLQHGDTCVPPTPQCQYGWRWNERSCEPERLTCPSGFELDEREQCVHEISRCPPHLREYHGQCIKDDPTCAHGYSMNPSSKICEKTVNKCPKGSFEQYGECLNVTYGCPDGAKEEGNTCVIEETVQKVVYEIKYVPQTMTIPGTPVASSCNYGTCQTPCVTSNCPQQIQGLQQFQQIQPLQSVQRIQPLQG